jgi:hypothetical protein
LKKNTFWFSNFQNNSNYIILVPQFFFLKSVLVQKIYFCYFLVPDWERRERGRWIPAVEREKYRWHWFIPLKQSIFVSNNSIWWGEFMLDVFFFTFKVQEKTYLRLVWFLVSYWFGIIFWFFEVIDRFITVPNVFWVEKRLKTDFLIKKKA